MAPLGLSTLPLYESALALSHRNAELLSTTPLSRQSSNTVQSVPGIIIGILSLALAAASLVVAYLHYKRHTTAPENSDPQATQPEDASDEDLEMGDLEGGEELEDVVDGAQEEESAVMTSSRISMAS